jgi:hypothetical protein
MIANGTVRRIGLAVMSVATGVSYGLLIRLGARLLPQSAYFAVMSIGFVFVLPFAMGFVTVYVIERRQPQHVLMWLLLSCLSVLLGIAGTMVVLWEGWICAVMFAPIGLIAGMLGGGIAGIWLHYRRPRTATSIPMACVMILPLLITPWEQQVLGSRDLRSVESAIDIDAPAGEVWKSIERVPRIQPGELPPSWSHAIGFPDPVEATLSREGLGGVRHATFAGGVLFIETIDVWEPQRRLGFSIRAQADQIPKTTLDEHVTVGGRYFDVLHGEYSLENLPGGKIRLHLVSRHRVSTDFNWYAHLWTDAVMRDLQRRILVVIKHRCELERVSRAKSRSSSSPYRMS